MSDEDDGLHPYEVAHLSAGAKGAVGAAVVSLVDQGRLAVRDGMLRPTGVGPKTELFADGVYRGSVQPEPEHPLAVALMSVGLHLAGSVWRPRAPLPGLSRRGRKLLGRLRARFAETGAGPSDEIALRFGLFGGQVLGSGLVALRNDPLVQEVARTVEPKPPTRFPDVPYRP